MTCTRVETLLALHAAGDLGAGETRAVETHLAACPGCRAEAASYERSQNFMREDGPPPFDERDYAAIRRAVQRRLLEESSRATFPRRVFFFLEGKRGVPALALACALLVAAIALRPFLENQRVIRSAGAQAIYPSRKDPLPSPELPPVMRSGAAEPFFPSRQKRSAAAVPTFPVRRAIASVVSRIELQTSNPNVRIIWLVGSQPARPNEIDSEDGI